MFSVSSNAPVTFDAAAKVPAHGKKRTSSSSLRVMVDHDASVREIKPNDLRVVVDHDASVREVKSNDLRVSVRVRVTYLEVPAREFAEISPKICQVETPCLILSDLNDVSATLPPRQEVRVMLKGSDEHHGPSGTGAFIQAFNKG